MSTAPKVYPDPEVDREAVMIRGICGAVLGVVMAIVIWLRCGGSGALGSVVLFAGSIVTCAIGSIRHGDAFWYGVLGRGR